jgi:hypothetical protein
LPNEVLLEDVGRTSSGAAASLVSLQVFDLARFLIARTIPFEREAR